MAAPGVLGGGPSCGASCGGLPPHPRGQASPGAFGLSSGWLREGCEMSVPWPGVEPEPSRWVMPVEVRPDPNGFVALGADLEPGTVLAAYRHGLFPMPARRRGGPGWWSPDPRGILPLDGLKVSRSLRRSCARYEVRVDTAFAEVIASCGDPRRPHGWIDRNIVNSYTRLHEMGWVHSVESWTPEGELVGGLYGIAVGGLFAGESMFSHRTDASKVALVGLVDRLNRAGYALLDVQWVTDHLASLGAIEIPRQTYLARLAQALDVEPANAF